MARIIPIEENEHHKPKIEQGYDLGKNEDPVDLEKHEMSLKSQRRFQIYKNIL